ncbi:MAG: cache domain-containing protein [Nanoarchaeota archaeon]|nr:cache domain-containing protein [Nanoarchaeota archaeon]
MKPKSMVIIGVGIIILINIIGITFFYVISSNILKEKSIQHLQTAAESRADHIETFLDGKKGRAIDFSSDGFIINSLTALKEKGANSIQIAVELRKDFLVNKLPTDKDLYEIDILDASGIVVGTTQIEEELGKDESNDVLFLKGKRMPYVKDAFYDEEFGKDAIAISAPIINEGEFLGIVIIKMGLETLAEITTDRTGLGETGEIYLINKESLLVTPSRFLRGKNQGVLTQVVDTENARKCFEGLELFGVFDDEELKEHSKTSGGTIFRDYRGEAVIGVHSHVLGQTWCLLAQIDKSEVLGQAKITLLVISVVIILITSILVSLIAVFIGKSFERGKKRK